MNPFPDDADGGVLSDLASQGVDMTRPLQFEFFVVAPDEDTSKLIGDAVTKAGYEASVEYEEGEPDENGEFDPEDEEFGPSWTVYAYVTMVPNYDEVIRIQDELDKIADPFGGFSDGWGVIVDPETDMIEEDDDDDDVDEDE